MKQTALTALVAAAFGCIVAAQDGNPPQQAGAPARTSANVITVVGCIQPDEGGAAEAPGTPRVSGSRANSTFVLTNVITEPVPPGARQTDAARTGAARNAAAAAPYTLEGRDMTEYAAQQVEVTGTLVPAPSAAPLAQSSGRGANTGEPRGERIRVTNVRRIATSCPAQPQPNPALR